jgi:hypothetical protein
MVTSKQANPTDWLKGGPMATFGLATFWFQISTGTYMLDAYPKSLAQLQ